MEDDHEDWLIEKKDEIAAKIGRGLAQLDRREGITGDELRARLEADRAVWWKERQTP